jgi:hypothetical protein
MREKGADFRRTHGGRMTFVLEEDKAPNPIDISLFGPDAVMFQANFLTYKVEEFGL